MGGHRESYIGAARRDILVAQGPVRPFSVHWSKAERGTKLSSLARVYELNERLLGGYRKGLQELSYGSSRPWRSMFAIYTKVRAIHWSITGCKWILKNLIFILLIPQLLEEVRYYVTRTFNEIQSGFLRLMHFQRCKVTHACRSVSVFGVADFSTPPLALSAEDDQAHGRAHGHRPPGTSLIRRIRREVAS